MTFQANEYAINDFQEMLHILEIDPKDVRTVVGAWGCNDDGWSGGFVVHLFDGRYAYASGWCDYTGWGCQDDADVWYFDHEPTLQELIGTDPGWVNPEHIDPHPADLNKWIQDGARQKDVWV